jgi:hypothetical protein
MSLLDADLHRIDEGRGREESGEMLQSEKAGERNGEEGDGDGGDDEEEEERQLRFPQLDMK